MTPAVVRAVAHASLKLARRTGPPRRSGEHPAVVAGLAVGGKVLGEDVHHGFGHGHGPLAGLGLGVVDMTAGDGCVARPLGEVLLGDLLHLAGDANSVSRVKCRWEAGLRNLAELQVDIGQFGGEG